jgi:hypothetical protein
VKLRTSFRWGFLGLIPEPLLLVDWKIGEPECLLERLELLYERIHEFSTNLLYSQAARFSIPGLNWAPQTFRIDG